MTTIIVSKENDVNSESEMHNLHSDVIEIYVRQNLSDKEKELFIGKGDEGTLQENYDLLKDIVLKASQSVEIRVENSNVVLMPIPGYDFVNDITDEIVTCNFFTPRSQWTVDNHPGHHGCRQEGEISVSGEGLELNPIVDIQE